MERRRVRDGRLCEEVSDELRARVTPLFWRGAGGEVETLLGSKNIRKKKMIYTPYIKRFLDLITAMALLVLFLFLRRVSRLGDFA
jgi:hypothetical protein